MRFWNEISDLLAGLTGSATPEETRQALNEFDVRDIQAVRVSEGGGGNGGSQTVRLIGPFHYDYTDFPVDDTELVVFTPDAGDQIRGRVDVASAVAFNDSGSIDFSFGEDPDFNSAVVPGTFWGFVGNFFDPGAQPPDSDNGDADVALYEYISTGLPLKIRAQSVVGDGTAGAMDLYFLVATPTAP